MLALRLAPEIEKRLEALARKTGRTKSFYAREAILRHLDDIEDAHLARERRDAGAGGSASKRLRRSSGPGRRSERAALARRVRSRCSQGAAQARRAGAADDPALFARADRHRGRSASLRQGPRRRVRRALALPGRRLPAHRFVRGRSSDRAGPSPRPSAHGLRLSLTPARPRSRARARGRRGRRRRPRSGS